MLEGMTRGIRRERLLAMAAVVAVMVAAWVGFRDDDDGDASPAVGTSARPADTDVGADERPARHAEALTPSTVWIEVVSAAGNPVVGAAVKLRSAVATSEQRTDVDGVTVVERLWPGAWRVEVSASGYAPLSTEEVLRPGLAEAAWSFRLEPEGEMPAALRGVVLSQGVPVAGAFVAFTQKGDTLEAGAVLTKADGRFAVSQVPGADGVLAFHEAHGLAARGLDDNGDLVLELPAPGFVEGRVLDDRGQPLASFSVQALTSGLPPGFARALATATGGRGRRAYAAVQGRLKTAWSAFPVQGAEGAPGRFRVGPVPAGSVRVVASADGRAPADQEVTVKAGAATSVELRLAGPVVVTGCVTDANTNKAIGGAQVSALRTPGPDAPGFGSARTDDEGCYRLLTTAEVRHSVAVRARGYVAESAGGLWGRADEEVRRDFSLQPSKGNKREGFRYVGIGARMSQHEDGAQVVGVFKTGSAAGSLHEGDVVLRVDGVWTEGLPLPRIVEMIVGEDGTDVELLVQPKGGGPVRTVVLPRRQLSSNG